MYFKCIPRFTNVCFSFWIDLGSGDEKVKKLEAKKFLTPGYSVSGRVELYTVSSTCLGRWFVFWIFGCFPFNLAFS